MAVARASADELGLPLYQYIGGVNAKPVSYTHLDVYKRQN